MFKKVDLVIIGGGPAGYEAAFKAVDGGMTVVIIEKEAIGGTCLNHGCIPTKTIMHSTELFKKLETSEEFGIILEKKSIDFEVVQNRKEEIVEKLRRGILSRLIKSDIEVILGEGKIISKNLVRVDDETIEARFILIATGTGTLLPPIKGCDLAGVITSDELLEYNKKPFEALTIIGGGVIGMEFANIFSDVGTQVTVIEALDRIIPNMDKELSQSLKMTLKKQGIDIHTSSFVEEIIKTNEGLSCKYKGKGKEAEVTSNAVLIAVGRKPNISNVYADNIEIEIEKGFIKVNDNYQTNYLNIYAVGDVIGGIQLAHVASAEGKNAVDHMLGREERIDVKVIPSCIYTTPEIASVGITSDEAKRDNIKVITKKFPMLANGKTVLSGMDRGYIKIIADEKTHKILGAQMMCGRATDMISELTVSIANELTLEDVKKVIHPHPTFSEGIGDALK
jgi:dihydrolipoamide dehydrogenase